ncbi:MAG: hypothetical protein AB9900_12805 [Humidesulfovibrio sp.]
MSMLPSQNEVVKTLGRLKARSGPDAQHVELKILFCCMDFLARQMMPIMLKFAYLI